MYQLAKENGVAEVVDTRRCYRDFLLAVKKQDPILAETHEYIIETATDTEAEVVNVMEEFRHSIRLRDIHNSRSNVQHSAFATEEDSSRKDINLQMQTTRDSLVYMWQTRHGAGRLRLASVDEHRARPR